MSVISGIWGAEASASAADTSAEASNRAADLNYQMYREGTQTLAPYVSSGSNALAKIGKLQGGDYSQFYKSPDYNFALQEGLKAQQRQASATGRLGSGDYIKDATKYAEGIASQEYGNFYTRLQNIAQMGQSAAARQATNALTAGETIGGLYQSAGNAQASGTLGVMNAGTNALRNIGQQALDQYYRNPQTYGPAWNTLGGWGGTIAGSAEGANAMAWL